MLIVISFQSFERDFTKKFYLNLSIEGVCSMNFTESVSSTTIYESVMFMLF